MEEDYEAKYICKLCNKWFACGRSLGGHMRSHVIYPTDQKKLQKIKRALSVKIVGTKISIDSDSAGYGLREKPKKTCRFDDESEDTLLHVDKICKECGKAFPSLKALFGHMKCHSEQDSWTSTDQSVNGKANPKKKRSSGRTKRYYKMETSGTTTSLSNKANASSSVSEIDQEQEEVALCLIMLSQDVTHRSGTKYIGESSVNNSEFIDAQSFIKPQFKELESNGGETVNFNKQIKETLRYGSKMSRSEIKFAGLTLSHQLKKSKVVENLEFQVSEVELERTWINGSKSEKVDFGTKKITSIKRKVFDSTEPKITAKSTAMFKEDCVQSRKYECACCNKAFNTFQALGGHRASHKRMKGCFGLKTDVCENSIVGTDHNISINSFADNTPIAHEMAADSNGTKKINNGGSHECPICSRVFSSGQALGGHKRSHLVADAKHNQSIPSNNTVTPIPVPVIRDFLDLNLPAPDEDDTNTSLLGFDPWWIDTNKNNGTLLGLLI